MTDAADFDAFLDQNKESLRGVLYQEYLKQKREQSLREVEKFNFYLGKTVIAGTAIGLPGTGNKVFNANNFNSIINGNNFIEPLSAQEKEKIVDMNITRVFKQPDGNARFLKITDTKDVIQLAGKLGYFNLKNEYGVDFDYDITISLSIAAGIEALKDARIPMVLQHKKTSTGQYIPAGYALPRELQNGTGVIMTSLFPGFETLIEQLNKYYYNKFYVRPYKELENIYYHLMESVRDGEIKAQITDWFFKIKERRKKYGTYQFERNLLFDVVPLGSAHFAQLIKAKGPNMLMSGACASTTQAIGVAEDWIRTGRCERVVVIGGEASTTETQSPWIASGFLALGAASIKNLVSEAAKPFDADRNGTILGAGAVSLIVEREDQVRKRGLNGQAEILGTYIGNSAYHATQIDLDHLTETMEGFVRRVEKRHGLDRDAYTRKMVFMSHETFTPARGGSASAEVASLKKTFPDHYRDITITNTKGYTGHTLGAAIEDAVMVKALQQRQVPPIANLTNIPEEFADLRFSRDATKGNYDYGLHYAAGFGSHFAFLMIRRMEENQAAENPQYQTWLQQISGLKRPRLTTINNTLCIDPSVISPVTDAPPKPAPAVAQVAESLPPAQPAASAPPTPTPAPGPDVRDTVKAIIAEQTGYTIDMLEDALDLEADLGIDTVKQVEIFGKVSENFGLEVPEDLKLRDLNTIAKLADYLARQIPAGDTRAAGPATAPERETTAPTATTGPENPVKRLVVTAIPVTPESSPQMSMADRKILITTRGGPYAPMLADKIVARGGQALIVGGGDTADIPCNWQDLKDLPAALTRVGDSLARVDGVIHLVPLEGYTPSAIPDRHRLRGGLTSFFRLIQGLYDQLDRPGTFIAMPSLHSTVFPYREANGPIDPLMAGVAGLLKTVNKELSETLVKVVDFAEGGPEAMETLLETLLEEVLSGDPRVECGYADGKKWVLQLSPKAPQTQTRFIRDGDTLLVTGGARGITFEILKALVSSVKIRLVILGRSNLDDLDPALADPDIEAPAIMAQLKSKMPGAKPIAIKQALNRTLGLRASTANLAALRALGAGVDYHAVDVTDTAAVAAVLAAAGPLDGVLHAAGIEESQFIPKKTLASFDRVLDTKVMGLANLMSALGDQAPRYLMTFSSVTARLGNEGQVDYTAANDMIGKMLQQFRAAHPETIVKILDWTAWEGAGMATNETVNQVLKERGLTFLPLEDGVAHFMRELGDTSTVEVLFSGIDHAFDADGLLVDGVRPALQGVAPFLDELVTETDQHRTYRRTLDLERDLFLLDHSRDDIPIFLGATGIEAMAEAAAHLAPPNTVMQELQGFKIPYGIKILKKRPKEIRVEAVRQSRDTILDCRITSQFRNPQGVAMGQPTLHYQGTYRFGSEPLPEERIALPPFIPVAYEGNIQDLLYHPSRLFMDGLFRTVEEILSFEPQRLIARIVNSSTKPFFADGTPPAFMTDVALVDAMFQTGGMLEVMTTNVIVLPYSIGRMRFYRPMQKGAAYLCITEKTNQGTETNTYQLRLVDTDGLLHMAIDDFEMVQVDRLAEEDQILKALQTQNVSRRAS
jgi:3-oxoacyl-(acyl-carrier-protein) synthase/NAD(P)-dependent dehydrogenase (short-subunit alcohol dehydrogenase family)/acyl carrier protein